MTLEFFACCTWRVEKTRTFPLHIKDVQVLSGWLSHGRSNTKGF